MKKTFCLILIFILTTTYLSFAAEETQTQDDKGQEFEKTKELEKIAVPKPAVERFVIEYGGWLSSTIRKYKNTDNDNPDTDNLKRSWEQDIRLWLWMTYLNKYTAYLRIRDTNIDRITGSGYTGIGNDN